MSRLWGLLMVSLCLVVFVACDDDDDGDECEDVENACSEAGEARCNADNNIVEECQENSDGCLQWTDSETCGDAQECQDGVCECQNECEEDTAPTCDGDTLVTCEEDADGCYTVREQDCTISDGTCVEEDGSASCVGGCENECDTEDESRCAGSTDVIETCTMNDEGCLEWVEGEDCSEDDLFCDDSSGAAECVPDCTNDCETLDETRCSDDDVIETCEMGDDGCMVWATGTDCTVDADYCDDSSGDATCESCVNDCDTVDAMQCDGTVIETCTADDNGCLAWVEGDDCATSDQVCDDRADTVVCSDAYEVCDNTTDDDGDGDVDCLDSDCDLDAACEEICDNDTDDDGDGDTDCEDIYCEGDAACPYYAALYEEFTDVPSGDVLDLQGSSITFTPDAAEDSGYAWTSADGVTDYAVAVGTGTTSTALTSLTDDGYSEYTFAHMTGGFEFYGVTYTSMYVASNGFVTFDSSRGSITRTISALDDYAAVALLAGDLNPTDSDATGDVVVDEFDDRVVVTWDGIPFYGESVVNQMQLILNSDGSIEMYYVSIPLEGVDTPEDFVVGVIDGVTGGEVIPPETDFVTPPAEDCGDGVDNDFDVLVDCDDPDCFGLGTCTSELICNDGLDNDGDGNTDCDDSECADDPRCLELGGCADPIVVSTLPYMISGVDFMTDFTNDQTFTDDSCEERTDSPEAIFQVAMLTGEVLRISEFGGLNVDVHAQTTCGDAEACVLSSTYPEDGLTYTAEADGDVYVIIEAYDGTSSTTDYDILLEISEDEVCDNEFDDDFDGVADCEDSDCYLDAACLARPGEIIITELMKNPSAVDDGVGEWFELYNDSEFVLSLEGAVISDDGTDTHTITGELLMDPGTYLVLGNNSDSATNGGVTVDYVYGGDITMGNGSDEVVLTIGGEEIDRVNYTDADFPDNAGVAMQLSGTRIDATLNDDGANWCDATAEIVTDGDLGTPGEDNGICIGTILYEEDFETDPSWIIPTECGDTATCDWEWGTPDASFTDGPAACAGGTGCYGTNLAGDYALSTDPNYNWVASPVIDLSTATAPYLAFDMWLDTEGSYDEASVVVTTDGGATFALVDMLTPAYNDSDDSWSGDFAGWQQAIGDLTAYAGESSVQIAFVLDADFSASYAGFYIDNFIIFE